MRCLHFLMLLVSSRALVISHPSSPSKILHYRKIDPKTENSYQDTLFGVFGKPEDFGKTTENPNQDTLFGVFGKPEDFGKTTENPNQDTSFGVFGQPEDFGETTVPAMWSYVFGTPTTTTQRPATDPDVYTDVFGSPQLSTQRSIIETPTTIKNTILYDECLLASQRKGVCVFYNHCNISKLTDGGNGQNDLDTGLHNICLKPLHVCCSKEAIEESRETSGGETDQKHVCGRANPQGLPLRSLNSAPTLFGEFPWMLAILRNEDKNQFSPWNSKTFIGGATLIGPRVAITAAHTIFVSFRDEDPMKVRAGDWNTQSFTDLRQHVESDIVDASIHEEFSPATLENNIAVLLLDTPLLPTDHIGYACLPPRGMTPPVGAGCYFTKWGDLLEKASMDIVGGEQCEADLRASGIYSSKYKLDKTLMCAGGSQNKETCKGMKGSPLICPFQDTNKQYTQHGIGFECSAGLPALYINVAFYRDWIDEQMAIAKQNTSTYSY